MAILPSRARPAAPWTARRAGDDYGARAQPDWREIDWREHLRSAEIRGHGVRYVDLGSGDGPPLVFVHGLAGCWQNWLENLPHFAEQHRAIAVDLSGFGHSELPREDLPHGSTCFGAGGAAAFGIDPSAAPIEPTPFGSGTGCV